MTTTIASRLYKETAHRFSDFTIRDKLGTSVIALDAEKKRLLFLTQTPNAPSLVIDLNSVNGCSVIKEYNSIHAGSLRENKLQKFLSRIFLNIRLGNRPVSLPVFNVKNDDTLI